MGVGSLTIYSASAGSGKTFRLAGIYLRRILTSPYAYRHILAVTFTNKATAEMKSRILDELNKLASGAGSRYLPGLVEATAMPADSIREEAGRVLHRILHDFSRFHVCTIDSFFQKILRAFARDIGIHTGFNIEIDHGLILAEAVEKLISSASSEPIVRNWLSDFIRTNIEDEKTWDLKKGILQLAEELFKEKFKLLSPGDKAKLHDKDLLLGYIQKMRAIRSSFAGELKSIGNECISYFEKFSLTDDMFWYKKTGVPGFVRALSEGRIKEPNIHVREIDQAEPKWCSGKISDRLAEAVSAGLGSAVIKAIRFYDEGIFSYNTANLILSNIYTLGILTDVLGHVRQITTDENVFLLSDTGELIYQVTGQDQSPFIYEKVGNIFENFMIDEFQDTSKIQWNNFIHLVDNSMAQGGDNLVVGDIKQSIYRWRNSDWRMLSSLKSKCDGERIRCESLDTNWRSCENIIEFNNQLFSVIPGQLDLEKGEEEGGGSFAELFSEVVQKHPPEKKKSGLVRIEFVAENEISWKEEVLRKIPGIIEYLEDRNYKARDIGILVRSNREGADILKYMIDYGNTCPDEKRARYNFNMVSADSLLLSNSPAVNFLISVLGVIDDPSDMISRATMLRYYLIAQGSTEADAVAISAPGLEEISLRCFPPDSREFLESVKHLTLWEITEKVTGFFGLGEYPFNVPYLNSFQDIIINYSSGKDQVIRSFLDWWETEGCNKSISLPGQQDSIQVMTIHKSKGLEFDAVILPFLSWNLDHKPFQNNILWIRPDKEPFNRVPILPVRYRKDLENSYFKDDYQAEKSSAYLDNLNLLYVALTRARKAMYGFAPEKPGNENKIAAVLKNAITLNGTLPNGAGFPLHARYDPSSMVFEYGDLPPAGESPGEVQGVRVSKYPVSFNLEPLKLKLHWEDYFRTGKNGAADSVNYGKMMHEVFGEINSGKDVGTAVRKKVLDGKITPAEEMPLCQKITALIEAPGVREWFDDGNEVLNEIPIVIPGSETRRPDRIIIRDGKVIIIDFKFGEERQHHLRQVSQYRELISGMGYTDIASFLWYVDSGKIIKA